MDKPLVEMMYKLADGKRIRFEVTSEVKDLLEQADRQIRSQRRQDRRRLDFTPLTDEFLEGSLLAATEDTADLYEKIERDARLHEAIDKLTEVQKHRLCLYYFRGLKYREIAELEGVDLASIGQSIRLALKQLCKLLTE